MMKTPGIAKGRRGWLGGMEGSSGGLGKVFRCPYGEDVPGADFLAEDFSAAGNTTANDSDVLPLKPEGVSAFRAAENQKTRVLRRIHLLLLFVLIWPG